MSIHPRARWSGGGALAVAAVVAVAGCGGGSGPSGTAGQQQSSAAIAAESAQPSLVTQLPADVASSKVLNVGVAVGTPPDEYLDADHNLVGWEVDVMTAAAESLGVKVDFKQASFDSLIPGLQAKRYDAAIGQFGVTSAREQVIDFVTTLQSNELFAARSDSDLAIKDLVDLCGHSVVTTRGSREEMFGTAQSQQCTASGKQPINIEILQDANQAGLAVISKRADVFWLGATAVNYFVAQSKGQTKIIGQYLKPNPLGIALPKNSSLGKPLQQAVQHLVDDGTYAKILTKWGIEKLAVTQSEINPIIPAN